MPRFLTIVWSIVALLLTACLDAPRDNIYDPENPNKAYLSMNIYGLGIYPLEGAVANLLRDGNVIKSDTSNELGAVVFENIDPGIYYFTAAASHYSPIEQGPESLWAGGYIADRRIEFLTLHFEDDLLGASSPHCFIASSGAWVIDEDTEEPEAHSTPNVYQGVDSSSSGYSLSLCEPEAQYFLLEAKLKVAASSENNWHAGVVFRFQDENNCYKLLISPDTTYCYYLVNGQPIYLNIKERAFAVDTWHTLKVERRRGESTIRISINNTVLFTSYDNIFSEGQVGLFVSNNDGPAAATTNFDDVTVDLTNTDVQ